MGPVFWWRRYPLRKKMMQPAYGLHRDFAQPGVEWHIFSPPDFLVEERSFGNPDVHHLLDTERLGA
jgi:hypothetical protein